MPNSIRQASTAPPPTHQGALRCGVALPVQATEVLAVVEMVSVAVPAVEPLMATGLVVPKLSVGGTTAFAGLEVIVAVSATLPVKLLAGVNVTVEVLPVVAPATTETAVPTMLKLGGRLMVYVALATGLVLNPAATAMASIVSVAETLIAPLYTAELAVGVVPFVV
jgi:hypothetical protein